MGFKEYLEAEEQNDKIRAASCIEVPKGTVLINRNGTSKTSPKCKNCGAWIDHWHELSGLPIPADGDCPVEGCDGCSKEGVIQPIEGCHVMIKGEGKMVYIAPLCKPCNHLADGAEMTLSRATLLVQANVAQTCDRLVDTSKLI